MQAGGRAKKLNCFQTKIDNKIKLLVRLCRLPGFLDSFRIIKVKNVVLMEILQESNIEKKYQFSLRMNEIT